MASVDRHRLQRELEAHLAGEVRFDGVSRALYATDASVYQIEPLGVVIPRSRADVERLVEIAGRYRCPLTPRGGGTSQAGQAIGPGLVVDTSKYLHRILEIDPEERWARVEPGVVLDHLNRRAAPFGLRFAPDPSTVRSATVGGAIGNNSSGARSLVYGKTLDHVLALEVLFADGRAAWLEPMAPAEATAAARRPGVEGALYGTVAALASAHADEIRRRFPALLRRVGGYNLDEFIDSTRPFNLAKLLVGSEGTLGFVLQAIVRLVPVPPARVVLNLEFPDLLEALGATPLVLRHGPSAVEVMDRSILVHAERQPALERLRRRVIQGDPEALLSVEFVGDRAAELPDRLTALERDLAANGIRCRSCRLLDPADQAALWRLREAALGLSMAVPGDARAVPFVEDTAVAPERLRDYIARFLEVVRRHGTTAAVYAHASVGCLHVRPVVNLKTEKGVRQFEAIAREVADLVLEFGGALSGEHGDGLVRGPFTEKMFGPVLYEAFRAIKRAADPDGIFNPGKILESPPLTANLRFGPNYVTPDPPTRFDFGASGGLGRAVELCSGLAACRKTAEGTMCPSFMATREEADSPRGRANVLRLAMRGRLADAGLDDRGVYQVLDLCLECRACKAECPVGVDVARLKSEFLAGYWQRHGTPLAARLFGHLHRVARWGSRLAPLSTWATRSVAGRWALEQLVGLDRRRRLPAWARPSFRARLPSRGAPDRIAPGSVVLFVDTWTDFVQPEVGLAAVRVLEALGATPALLPHGCCGRPLVSHGLLEAAEATVAATVERLAEPARRGAWIVVLEPSCLSALKEDAPALVRGETARRARMVADRLVLFDAFVQRSVAEGRRLQLRRGPSRIVVHAHCHQQAMGLSDATAAVMARFPGAEVTLLDAGCCGMAGAFGYLKRHYELSRRIGERRLLPAARALGPEEVLVAPGFSCRQQVADFAGLAALHPAVLLDRWRIP